MKIKKWTEYTQKEKEEILTYWFYNDINNMNTTEIIRKQIINLIKTNPDIIYNIIIASLILNIEPKEILIETISTNQINILSEYTKNISLSQDALETSNNFIENIVQNFYETVEIPNNETRIKIKLSSFPTKVKIKTIDTITIHFKY